MDDPGNPGGAPDAGQALPDAATADASELADGGSLGDAGPTGDAGEPEDAGVIGCVPPTAQFRFSTWTAVFANRCTSCHLPDGFAANADPPAEFILKDPENLGRGETLESVFQYNLEAVLSFRNNESGEPYMLPKVMNATPGVHGGGQQFVEGSESHQELAELFALVDRASDPDCVDDPDDVPSYREVFDRIVVRTPVQTYRTFTEQTLGRLPTATELRSIQSGTSVGRPPPDQLGPGQTTRESQQLRVVSQLMAVAARTPAYRRWLKDMWNDVFMFRGVFAQDLDRAYEVFSNWDYGARIWADLCNRKVPLTDEQGAFIDGPGDQPWCNLIADRFAYREVRQPHPNSNSDGLSGQEFLSAADACEYCTYTRRGLAELMLYGAVEEPLELIAATIQEGRPFTEIVTSEDLFMNYYTSMVYFGTADPADNDFTANMAGVPMVDAFRNGPNFVKFEVDMPDHRFFRRHTRMLRTNATQDHNSLENAEAPIRDIVFPARATFPRAGILTSAAFIKRFPSNDFNLHRHRAWQAMRLFLGYDILNNQGERISLADVDDPNGGVTLSNPDCASCHHKLDPVAGLFRDFHPKGHSRDAVRADEEWPDIIHPPGFPADFASTEVIAHDRNVHGAPIQFLAQRIVANPAFARTMVGYAWKHVMGSDPISGMGDIDEGSLAARTTLVLAQQRFFESLVASFVRSEFDMASVYQRLYTSIWYRAKGLKPAVEGGLPDEIYQGVGRFGTLTPEEYFRRVEAVYGGSWPLKAIPTSDSRAVTFEEVYKRDFFTRTDSAYKNFDLLYGMVDPSFSSFFGGVDFQNNLTRAEQVNSVMSLLAQRVANEFACLTVYADFKKAPVNRRFLPELPGLMDRPGGGGHPTEDMIRANLVHLFALILDLKVPVDGSEVDRAYGLYIGARSSVLAEVTADPVAGARMPNHCRMHEGNARGDDGVGAVHTDTDGQVRAWMAVVTYLMLQPEFLQR